MGVIYIHQKPCGIGEWNCFNTEFSFAYFPHQVRARWQGLYDQVKILSITYKIWIHDTRPDQDMVQSSALVPAMRTPEFR